MSSRERRIQSCALAASKKSRFNRGKTEDTTPFIDNMMKDADPESVSEIKTAITDKAAQGAAPTFSLNISFNSW